MKQNEFDCKHRECCMDGCYCKINKGANFNHCVLPFYASSCEFFESKDKEKEEENKKYIQANKIYSDATLESLKKEDLIKYIRTLEKNWSNAEQRIETQVQNFEKCLEQKNKETAREILQELYNEFSSGISYAGASEFLREYAKEKYGVEVE